MRMVRLIGIAALLAAPGMLFCRAQPPSNPPPLRDLNERGAVTYEGRKSAYLIRHLPVSSFPDLPAAVQAELNRRGCLIPQTYEAHHPENVIRGSFEKAGTADWAVLCSAGDTVSLLAFFASAPGKAIALASARETDRLQAHTATSELGFNWGLDTESPARVSEAQIGMEPKPAKLDHDAIGDSIVDGRTIYRYFANGTWKRVDTGE